MNSSRSLVLTVLILTAISVSDSCHEVRAQKGWVTTQDWLPNGTVTTVSTRPGDTVTTQNITPDGRVITQSIASDGTVFTQNILPDGRILSDGVPADRGAAKRSLSPSTLKSGLDTVVWDANQRGLLLAVAPETVIPAWQRVARKPRFGKDGSPLPFTFTPPRLPELLPTGRYRAADLADFFGYRIVRLRGMSVLAPREMAVLNTRPGKPDYFADLHQSEKLLMLQASLSAAQWKLIGSEDGLGANDLSPVQRALFVAWLPNPLVIAKPRVVYPSPVPGVAEEKPLVLSAGQRNSVRLRINRVVSHFSVPMPGSGRSIYLSGDPLGSESAEYTAVSYDGLGDDGSTVFGQQIRRMVPNRLKPQQIDFTATALQKDISLIGLTTVGELIERIRTATYTEIYGDERVAKRTLWVRSGDSQTIRASDALQALCWSLTGAVRYVSEGKQRGVFILTEDLEGIGARLTRMKDWAQAAQEHVNRLRSSLQSAVRQQRPMQYIGFAAGDSDALGTKANQAVEDDWKTARGLRQGATVPLTDFSPRQQETIRQRIASYNESRSISSGPPLEITESVSVSVQVRPVLLVPGIGVVRTPGSFAALNPMLPVPTQVGQTVAAIDPASVSSLKMPENLAMAGVFCVSPSTEEEARQVVRAAQERGLKQAWLVLPLVPAAARDSDPQITPSKALLRAAISEAQKAQQPIKILIGVRLFRLPADSEAAKLITEEADVTITGELPSEMAKRRAAHYIAAEVDPTLAPRTRQPTYNWAAPGSEGLIERVTRRISQVAATPGVSGIVLLDTSPLGYSSAVPGEQDSFAGVGYTPSSRLGFIRSAGFDPIDIASDMTVGNIRLRLPFLETGIPAVPPGKIATSITGEWNRFRSNLISKTLVDLHTTLMASLPKTEGEFPVYMQNLDAASAGNRWFSRWEKKAALPRRLFSEQGKALNTYPAAQEASALSLLDMGADLRLFNSLLTDNKGAWAGLVFNFSDVSAARALELVPGVLPMAKAPLR